MPANSAASIPMLIGFFLISGGLLFFLILILYSYLMCIIIEVTRHKYDMLISLDEPIMYVHPCKCIGRHHAWAELFWCLYLNN